jgi:hypothetical protein
MDMYSSKKQAVVRELQKAENGKLSYKSNEAMKIFSPAVRYNSANSWGRQLVEDTAGFLTRRNAFKVGEQDNIKAE